MDEDRHVIEAFGKVRVVIVNGEITEVESSEVILPYVSCNAWYG